MTTLTTVSFENALLAAVSILFGKFILIMSTSLNAFFSIFFTPSSKVSTSFPPISDNFQSTNSFVKTSGAIRVKLTIVFFGNAWRPIVCTLFGITISTISVSQKLFSWISLTPSSSAIFLFPYICLSYSWTTWYVMISGV